MAQRRKTQSPENGNPFVTVLMDAYQLMQYAESKVHSPDITITNYHVQSIGNSVGSYMVEVDVETQSGEKDSVKLRNWIPARNDVAGYNGEVVAHVKRNSGLMWEKASQGNFVNPTKEALAWVGYMFDGILRGDCMSSESSLKVAILHKALSVLKIKTLEIRISKSAEQSKPFVFNLSQIKSIVSGLYPRWETVEKLPEQTRTRQSSSVKVNF